MFKKNLESKLTIIILSVNLSVYVKMSVNYGDN
jgi:hypothetical protein